MKHPLYAISDYDLFAEIYHHFYNIHVFDVHDESYDINILIAELIDRMGIYKGKAIIEALIDTFNEV